MYHTGHEDWDAHLGNVQRDINRAVSKVTGKSPFKLLKEYKQKQDAYFDKILPNVRNNIEVLRDEAQGAVIDAQV